LAREREREADEREHRCWGHRGPSDAMPIRRRRGFEPADSCS
jgi:hypothetical protein